MPPDFNYSETNTLFSRLARVHKHCQPIDRYYMCITILYTVQMNSRRIVKIPDSIII